MKCEACNYETQMVGPGWTEVRQLLSLDEKTAIRGASLCPVCSDKYQYNLDEFLGNESGNHRNTAAWQALMRFMDLARTVSSHDWITDDLEQPVLDAEELLKEYAHLVPKEQGAVLEMEELEPEQHMVYVPRPALDRGTAVQAFYETWLNIVRSDDNAGPRPSGPASGLEWDASTDWQARRETLRPFLEETFAPDLLRFRRERGRQYMAMRWVVEAEIDVTLQVDDATQLVRHLFPRAQTTRSGFSYPMPVESHEDACFTRHDYTWRLNP